MIDLELSSTFNVNVMVIAFKRSMISLSGYVLEGRGRGLHCILHGKRMVFLSLKYIIKHCQIPVMSHIKETGCTYRGSNSTFCLPFSQLLKEEFALREVNSLFLKEQNLSFKSKPHVKKLHDPTKQI